MNEAESDSNQHRTKALIGLSVAVLLAVVGWFALSRAADSGVARLASIDRERARCEQLWGAAASAVDSQRVDRVALQDTIDPQSTEALARCGDLRALGPASAMPNPREMNGEPMPRGLR